MTHSLRPWIFPRLPHWITALLVPFALNIIQHDDEKERRRPRVTATRARPRLGPDRAAIVRAPADRGTLRIALQGVADANGSVGWPAIRRWRSASHAAASPCVSVRAGAAWRNAPASCRSVTEGQCQVRLEPRLEFGRRHAEHVTKPFVGGTICQLPQCPARSPPGLPASPSSGWCVDATPPRRRPSGVRLRRTAPIARSLTGRR